MSAKQTRLRFGALLLGLFLLALGGYAAHAQGNTIAVGQNATGSIDAANSAVQYQLTAAGGSSAMIQVLALQLGFTPTFRVLDPSGVEIASVANMQGLVTISGSVTFISPGIYTIEVGGVNGSTGQFALSVQPGAPAPQAIPLVLNLPTSGTVDSQTPLQLYTFDTTSLGAVTLTVLSQAPDAGPSVSIVDMSTQKTIASSDTSAIAVSYGFPANARQYQVSIRAGAAPSTYSICIGSCPGGLASGAVPGQAVPTAAPILLPATSTVPPAGCTASPNFNGSVNLRSGPGTNYLIQGTLPAGASAQVLAEVNFTGWYQVNYNGPVLWVGSSVVTLTGDCSRLPRIDPPANAPLAPTAVPTATPTLQATATKQATAAPSATPTDTEVPDGPDLAVQGMTIVQDSPSHARVTFDVYNLGTEDVTQPFYIYVCITTLCVEKQVTLSVRAGSATEVFADLNHPSSTTPETVAVAVDSRGDIRELNENNNTTSLANVSMNF